MNWEEKLAAIKSIDGSVSLVMRKPGDWYVSTHAEVTGGELHSVLSSPYGNGRTPQAAVEDHWRQLVDELPQDQYIVLNAMQSNRRHVRWNGHMWADLEVVAR